ncbi:hypothetical protein CLM71_00270 [Serratia sp. MYb239]|nr:hypothetical protein CLM71_00270 [Serratia sp. MYb239]
MTFCTIRSVTPLNDYIFRVKVTADRDINFLPGQNLKITMEDGISRYFSIASSVQDDNNFELHIASSSSKDSIINNLLRMHRFEVQIPLGKAWFRCDSQRPVILIAFGSGFSYIRSIFLSCLSTHREQPVFLYWIARDEQSFYEIDMINKISKKNPMITFTKIIEKRMKTSVQEYNKTNKILSDRHPDMSMFDIYIAGRNETVKALIDRLHANNKAKKSRIFSDSFSSSE